MVNKCLLFRLIKGLCQIANLRFVTVPGRFSNDKSVTVLDFFLLVFVYAGNIAHSIDVTAATAKRQLSFSLTYKNIDWNQDVKIDRNVPTNYSRMDAASLFSIFSN